MPSTGDAADDPCIWVHPGDPALSLVIGTDKNAGLAVFDLEGKLLQFIEIGQLNNVDVRYNFPIGGEARDIVVAGNRTTNTMAIFFVNADTRHLVEAPTAAPLALGMDLYGSCLYRSAKSGEFYAFFNSKEGAVQQWRLFSSDDAKISANLVRTFNVESQTEGCVADDEIGHFYLGEEARGIWKFDAEPDAIAEGTLIDSTTAGGHLTADVEGLAMFHGADGDGYLIASSQGSDEFVVYERAGSNAYVMTFAIGETAGIDNVTGADGIDVISTALGTQFPAGLFVAQDDENGTETQNFKLVSWQAIANATTPPLSSNPTWNPRGDANR